MYVHLLFGKRIYCLFKASDLLLEFTSILLSLFALLSDWKSFNLVVGGSFGCLEVLESGDAFLLRQQTGARGQFCHLRFDFALMTRIFPLLVVLVDVVGHLPEIFVDRRL